MKEYQSEFLTKAKETFGDRPFITRKEATDLSKKLGHGLPHWFLSKYSMGRNQYSLDANMTTKKWGDNYRKPLIQSSVDIVQEVRTEAEVQTEVHVESLVPPKDPNYIPAGHVKELTKIFKSGYFMPVFTTGLSGMGKTKDVFEACANTKRELIRVNVTIETDEDDLLGHFTLKNGETVWEDGPVVIAMERGSILLLDEIDLASNKIMCLQPILEGGSIFLKKINRLVTPAPGFNVVATANTKGKGSEDGRFIGTNILNEAFLDRFPLTFEQDYPHIKTEERILAIHLNDKGIEDNAFANHLVRWADVIRKTFFDGGIDEIISTRRLINIISCYAVFGDKQKAIQYSINRFDDETKNSFMDLYSKVDAEVVQHDEDSVEGEEDDSFRDKMNQNAERLAEV
jgi:hypothetical protein